MTPAPEAGVRTLPDGSAGPSSTQRPLRVMLLVSSLEYGGAERQIVELYRAFDRTKIDPVVCSLSASIPLGQHLPEGGREVVIVEKRFKYDVTTVFRVARIVRARRIDLVHAFLFDAEMVARLGKCLGAVPTVVSSERNSDYHTGPLRTLCLRLTQRYFDMMIANSDAGKRFNVDRFRIDPGRVQVIRNGVDVQRFQRGDPRGFRRELRIPDTAPLVGMVASFKRQKRHADFFEAARLVLARCPDAWFVCVGEPLADNQQGAAGYHREMLHVADRLGLSTRLRFAGWRDDMPMVFSAFDVTVLTSSREGTPNVLLESMACEVPVVATAVGDNAAIVADGCTGFIVDLGDVAAMADRICRVIENPADRGAMGAAGREWVTKEFSTTVLAQRTELVYAQATAGACPLLETAPVHR